MLRSTTSQLCHRCRLQAPLSEVPRIQWQAQRHASVMRDRRPARLTLSDRVGQSYIRDPTEKKPTRRRQNNPWGSTNLTKANIRGTPERSPLRSRTNDKAKEKDKGGEKKDGPFKALKMHRALTAISYNQRVRVKEEIKELDLWHKIPLLPIVQEAIPSQALPGLDDLRPTPVQRVAIPALLGTVHHRPGRRREVAPASNGRQDFLIAAETGSGKTLAYTLPLVDMIKRAEAEDEEYQEYEMAKRLEREEGKDPNFPVPTLADKPHPYTGRPRAIILVPTSELVQQVGAVLKSLSHTIKFKVALLSSSVSAEVIRKRLFNPRGIDIVVSTPHLLSSIAESDPNVLSRVSHMVIDEADSLLDRGFLPLTTSILDRANPSLKQLVMCSATIPRSMDNYLRKRHPNIQRLVTPNLHSIPRRVQLGVIDVNKEPYRGNKDLACADTIWTIGKVSAQHEGPVKDEKDVKRIVVFVNEREKSQELAEYLVSKKIDAVALNRDTTASRQSEILNTFTTPDRVTINLKSSKSADDFAIPFERPEPEKIPTQPRKLLDNIKVLVMTDLGSRGIDTVGVRHVILYDVPHSTVDFIHRLGRTGRMGRRGRGIVLVGKGDRRDVVREVQEGMYMGQALI